MPRGSPRDRRALRGGCTAHPSKCRSDLHGDAIKQASEQTRKQASSNNTPVDQSTPFRRRLPSPRLPLRSPPRLDCCRHCRRPYRLRYRLRRLRRPRRPRQPLFSQTFVHASAEDNAAPANFTTPEAVASCDTASRAAARAISRRGAGETLARAEIGHNTIPGAESGSLRTNFRLLHL